MLHFYKKAGFTLVELMVVIGIIGILTAIISVNFNEAREVSRDKVRQSDLQQLQLAVELYKAQNGEYPTPDPTCSVGAAGFVYQSCDAYISGLTPDFIAALPRDSRAGPGEGFAYRVDASGDAYKILVYNSVESITISGYSDEFARCPLGTPANAVCPSPPSGAVLNTYAAYSFGAEAW